MKGKPPKKDEPPVIVSLWVENYPIPSLPGEQVTVHYTVTDDIDIKEIYIAFLYDNNDDEFWHIVFASRVYRQTIDFPGDADTYLSGTIEWDGSVYPDYSSSGFLFDQFATEPNPDTYLIDFWVSDENHTVRNWTSGDDPYDLNVQVDPDSEIVLINPTEEVDEFHVTEVKAKAFPPSRRKGRYAAELHAEVTCNQGGFKGRGQWVQVRNGVEGSLTDRSGTPTVHFYDDDNNGTATTTRLLLVGPGTYRFYVKTVYSPDYSYNPWYIEQSGKWPWPEEPNDEVVVP